MRLLPGYWETRQRVNREASLRHGASQLERAGNFGNFSRLVEGSDTPHGHADASDGDVRNFVDSDVYKWLEAVGWEGSRGPLSDEVEAVAGKAIEWIVGAQDEDGYLNTWYQTQPSSERFSNMQYGHELYCLGHLIQAGIAWSRGRDDDRLLTAGRRFADLVVRTFGDGAREEVCGHPEIEMALVELTRQTGDNRYLEMAAAFIRRRGHGLLGPGRFGSSYYQDHVAVTDASVFDGHAVRALYLASGAVDVASETGDEDILAAVRRQWSNLLERRMYISGGAGSRHHGESFGDDFELPPDRAYCETCAAIAVVMLGWRLLLVSRDSHVADAMERTMLNGMLAGVSSDGLAFNYDNPLQARTSHPRQSWFEIACCPPNIMRTLAGVDQLVATHSDNSLDVHQFMSARIEAQVATVRLDTAYPVDGVLRFEVEEGNGYWRLGVRVPSWASHPEVTVNGSPFDARISDDGYLDIEREWSVGDALIVVMAMSARIVEPDPRVDAIRGTVAIERGPVVYALEALDAEANAPFDNLMLAERAIRTAQDGSLSVAVRARDSLISHQAALIPYASTGNREPTPFRVWLPFI